MARKESLLTELQAKALKLRPGEKLRRVPDGRGLYLTLEGESKRWEFRYTYWGRQGKIGLGV